MHVGTHGNLEFLPGKAVGLSRRLLPGYLHRHHSSSLHLQRRQSAGRNHCQAAQLRRLVDHMQTVMTHSGLYGELMEVDRTSCGEYETAPRSSDGGRAHALELRHPWPPGRRSMLAKRDSKA